MEPLPIKKKHGICLKVDRKENLKKNKIKTEIGEEQDGTKDSGTFFFAGGSFFIFELGF